MHGFDHNPKDASKPLLQLKQQKHISYLHSNQNPGRTDTQHHNRDFQHQKFPST